MSERTDLRGARSSHRRFRVAAVVGALALIVAACGSDTPDTTSTATTDVTPSAESITLVTYDSFPESDTSLNDALGAFTADTGIDVEILVAGDTGTMLAKAALTAGNP
ncbi:MAG: hypothetical protein WBP59_13240, partial [Ilumatobacteraceae bacterium]